MLSHNLPVKIEPQQNEAYNTKFKTNIVWNQKLKDPHFEATASPKWRANTAYGTYTIGGNKITYTIATKNANEAIVQDGVSFTQGHVYLTSFWVTTSENQIVASYTGNSVVNLGTVTANERTRIIGIFPANKTGVRSHYIYVGRNGGIAVGGTAVLEDCCLYDLTVMFGEGKEYIGREMFFKNFTANYYDYDESETPVPFTWTVYGGSLDVKTGALTITHSRYEFTGTEGWTLQSGSTLKYWTNASDSGYLVRKAKLPANNNLSVPIHTDIGDFNIAYNNLQNYQYSMCIASDSRLAIHSTLYSGQGTLEGIGVVYELAMAVTFQLSSSEVKTLLGNNKISSNATELQLTYKNSQNENVSLEGSNEYTIEDGVFDREVVSATNLFSYKQNLNGWTCPYLPGLGPIKLDFELVQGSESGVDYDTTQRVYGDNFVLLDSHGNAPSASSGIDVNIPVRNGNFYNQGKSTLSISIPTAHWPDRQVTLDNLMLYVKLLNEEMGIQDGIFIYDLNEPISYTDTLTNNNQIAYVQLSLYKRGTETFPPVFLPLNIQYDYSDTVTPINYNVLPVPHYTNICPIEGYTESSVTVEGDRVPDSESERRLKAITRPVFQWDFGLKLKFEGYTFADGTLCQFDNKITAYSLNATIENNECTIPFQLLDENCQGDIVAYVNVSGSTYDVVVYEVYIPVIKRPKPENFLRPAIDLPSAVIASFADGADDVPLEKLKIAVTPKQDLHGYDYPWVSGGAPSSSDPETNICPITGYTAANVTRAGKNLFDLNYFTATGITIADGVVSGTAATFHTNFGGTAGGIPIPVLPQGQLTLSFDVKTDGNASTSGNGLVVRFHYTDNTWTGIMKANNATAYSHEVITSTANKVVDYIYISYSSTGSNIWYLKNIQLESASSETNYESYKGQIYNIPFSFEGQNVFTRDNETDGKYINSSGGYTNNGSFAVSDYLQIEPQKRYVITDGDHGTATGVYHAWYDANKTFIRSEQWNQEFIISPSNARYLRVSYRTDRVITSICIEVGLVPHGTINVLTGILTQDYAYISDLSYYNYSVSTGVLFYTYPLSGAYKPEPGPERLIGIASSGYRISLVQALNLTMTPYSMARANGRLYFRNDDYSNSAADFKASLSDIQAIYELEEPCIYQLTPTEVKTLLGYNNIWADTGEVEVSYYADPYLHFID